MNNKKVIILFFSCVSSTMLLSQEFVVEVNGTNVSLGKQHVSSDFGRRECCSNFHDGVDSADGIEDRGLTIQCLTDAYRLANT